jgi:uncharacterized protein (DUF488 family)
MEGGATLSAAFHTVYTLGYQGTSPEALRAKADELGATIVDVRYSPNSRDPRWRQANLVAVLGSRYRHVREFGNVNFKGGPIRLLDPVGGTERIRGILQKRPVILLCVCRDVEVCHRKAAAQHLERSLCVNVEHLAPLQPASDDRQCELF